MYDIKRLSRTVTLNSKKGIGSGICFANFVFATAKEHSDFKYSYGQEDNFARIIKDMFLENVRKSDTDIRKVIPWVNWDW